MANLKLTETVLCSAPTALKISQMPIDDIVGSLNTIDSAGYYSCEVMNRDMFYNLVKNLKEDPWNRIQKIAQHLKNTRLQVTFAGSYIWGDKLFDESVISFFMESLSKNNINIVRMFDPLNDATNMKKPIEIARANNLHVQGAIIYAVSEFHNNATFLNYAKKLIQLGADSICICDPSELLNPYSTYSLIAELKKEVSVPVQFSTPNSTGAGYMNTLKAIEAGIDILDTTISPFAGGTSFPATETIIDTFKDTPYRVDMNMDRVENVETAFTKLQEKYLDNGQLSAKKLIVNPTVIHTKMPDNMLDYIDTIVKSRESILYAKLIDEIGKLREMAGNPPYIFPIYIALADQALINISTATSFSSVSEEFFSLIRGDYGKTPATVDPVFKDTIMGAGNKSTVDIISLDGYKKKMPEKYNEQSEDILTLAQVPNGAPEYFEIRTDRLYGVDDKHSDKGIGVHPV